MTPAEQLLRKVPRIVIDKESSREVEAIIAGQPDWRELMAKARSAGLGSLVFFGLREAGLAHLVPADIWESLRHTYLINSVRNSALMKGAESLVARLSQEGIGVVALKGAALLATVYPAVGIRHLSDVDLLVSPGRADDAAKILAAMGFVYHDKGELGEEYASDFVKESNSQGIGSGLIVELHKGLVSENAPFTIDLETIWKRAIAIKVGQAEAMALSPEDQIHHLAAHLFDHHFVPAHQWRNICDLGAILQHYGSDGIDWEYLLHSSQKYRTVGVVFLALNALDESFKTRELGDFLEATRAIIRAAGIADAVEALSRRVPRYDFDTLTLLPSTVTQIVEEPSIPGKLRIALASLSSRKRLIAFQG